MLYQLYLMFSIHHKELTQWQLIPAERRFGFLIWKHQAIFSLVILQDFVLFQTAVRRICSEIINSPPPAKILCVCEEPAVAGEIILPSHSRDFDPRQSFEVPVPSTIIYKMKSNGCWSLFEIRKNKLNFIHNYSAFTWRRKPNLVSSERKNSEEFIST